MSLVVERLAMEILRKGKAPSPLKARDRDEPDVAEAVASQHRLELRTDRACRGAKDQDGGPEAAERDQQSGESDEVLPEHDVSPPIVPGSFPGMKRGLVAWGGSDLERAVERFWLRLFPYSVGLNSRRRRYTFLAARSGAVRRAPRRIFGVSMPTSARYFSYSSPNRLTRSRSSCRIPISM